MAKIKINLAGGELTIEFSDTKDLEDQIAKIDLVKIDTLFEEKKRNSKNIENSKKLDSPDTSKTVKDLGAINLLKIPEGGQDAIKLAVFLAANGMNREEIKKIIGVTILSS